MSYDAASETDEPHPTFVENALAKARHASRVSGLPALADDSGVCVAALSGVPGVQSARYAGEPRSDRRNNARLIADLDGVADRRAHYYCMLALMRHGDDPEPVRRRPPPLPAHRPADARGRPRDPVVARDRHRRSAFRG